MSDCSTHAYDVPLKPCPFCGSGWLYETRRNGYCDETPTMFCNSCKAVVTWEQVEEEGVNDETKAFVREHWNSRAERTCENVKLRQLIRYMEPWIENAGARKTIYRMMADLGIEVDC